VKCKARQSDHVRHSQPRLMFAETPGAERAAQDPLVDAAFVSLVRERVQLLCRGAISLSTNAMDVPWLRRSCPRATPDLVIEAGQFR
jgi:hypothetical protein